MRIITTLTLVTLTLVSFGAALQPGRNNNAASGYVCTSMVFALMLFVFVHLTE